MATKRALSVDPMAFHGGKRRALLDGNAAFVAGDPQRCVGGNGRLETLVPLPAWFHDTAAGFARSPSSPTPTFTTPLVAMPAPHFTAPAVSPVLATLTNVDLVQFKGQPVVLVFYPSDFDDLGYNTLQAYASQLSTFRSTGCKVLACSVDSQWVHMAWARQRGPRSIANVDIPLVADLTKSIVRRYSLINESTGFPRRAAVVIDPNQTIRAFVRDMPSLQDEVSEVLTIISAIA
ncbi:Peroxiredoxin 1 [Dimargaris xerosporica]|nr:Peroxiredoxin 1 [Dimargaris xerosporica]